MSRMPMCRSTVCHALIARAVAMAVGAVAHALVAVKARDVERERGVAQTLPETVAPSKDMPQERNFSTKYLIGLVIAIVSIIAAVATGYWYIRTYVSPQTEAFPPALAVSIGSALQADSVQAAQESRVALESMDLSNPYRAWAGAVLADSLYGTATTTEQMIEAVLIMKRQLAAAQTPYSRAVAINKIASAVFELRNPVVDSEAYKDEPLASLLVEGDTTSSFNNLVGYSLDTFPTFDAYMLLARSAADRILLSFKPGTNQPVSTTISTAQLQSLVSVVDEYTTKAHERALRDQELAIFSPFQVTVKPWQDFWMGHTLGAAARVDSSYLNKAETALNAAAEAYDGIRDDQGNTYPILAGIKVKAELAHARLLSAVAGSSRSSDIRAHLDTFTRMITGDIEQFSAFHRFFEQAKTGGTITVKDKETNNLYRSFVEYRRLAGYSPEFAAYLKSKGWDI